ncbi:hypothetical protein T4A_11200 [Trichinella pseudospiralis]|uniref:Uncharacterized protein n=1 Tax=Trichinella pseudospiralis TaxID=6337 RepID=A0A0V1DYJ5_TRIPS|nr:hypothetical protein T4A_11200 [Trichinella pseudospiralis]
MKLAYNIFYVLYLIVLLNLARKHHLGFSQFAQLIIDEQCKTENVVRQMDDGHTREKGSVRRSAMHVALLTDGLHLPYLIVLLHLYDYCITALFIILQKMIIKQDVMDIMIQQLLSGNASIDDLTRLNSVYAEKQEVVAQYADEYNNGRLTLQQLLYAKGLDVVL